MTKDQEKQVEKIVNENYREQAKQMRITASAIDDFINARAALPNEPSPEQLQRYLSLNQVAEHQTSLLYHIFAEAKRIGELVDSLK
jgi:hypothetical protein